MNFKKFLIEYKNIKYVFLNSTNKVVLDYLDSELFVCAITAIRAMKTPFWASWYARCHLVCAFVLVTLLSQIYVELKQEAIASNQSCCFTQLHLQSLQLGGIYG